MLWLFPAPVVHGAPVHLVDEPPVKITAVGSNITLIDFGRVAFGNLRLIPTATATNTVIVHFGEAFTGGRIDRNPPGSQKRGLVVDSRQGNCWLGDD